MFTWYEATIYVQAKSRYSGKVINMKVSLVLATLGKRPEVLDFEVSKAPTYKDFELIIIDQNKDGKIDAIIEPYKVALM